MHTQPVTLKKISSMLQNLREQLGNFNTVSNELFHEQERNNVTFQLTLEEGKFLVNLARQTVTEYLKNGEIFRVPDGVSPKLMEKAGVFVTLNSHHNGKKMLRGCIGLPYPTTPLAKAVTEAALSAATQDPRFPPVTPQELDHITFEVSVLTPPERVTVGKPTDYPSKIKVGRDGLITERSYRKGLLLPQVPVEWNWNEEEFLCQCCMKAGLPSDSWLLKDTKIYRFSSIIAEEDSPNGHVKLIDMRESRS
jgi:uncharacterized protein (TIGR00296 family)